MDSIHPLCSQAACTHIHAERNLVTITITTTKFHGLFFIPSLPTNFSVDFSLLFRIALSTEISRKASTTTFAFNFFRAISLFLCLNESAFSLPHSKKNEMCALLKSCQRRDRRMAYFTGDRDESSCFCNSLKKPLQNIYLSLVLVLNKISILRIHIQ